jgi:sulfur relay (sulfurtransferase) DsrC/TusE family protein
MERGHRQGTGRQHRHRDDRCHWALIKFLREDYKEKGETATTRRVDKVGGFPTKQQFQLFPKKPGRKMSYVAGLPKPHGCV